MRPSIAQSQLQEHLGQLSRLIDEVRAQMAAFRMTATRSGLAFPVSALEGLQRISDDMASLRHTFDQNEGERLSLEALTEVGQVINSSLDLTTVLNEVIDTIIRLTGAERAFLMLRNDRGEMDIFLARNWERETLEDSEIEVSRTIVRRVLVEGEGVWTTNAQADPRFGRQDSIVTYNLRSILCVPLKVKGTLTGVLYADNKVKEGLFTDRERKVLSAFANQAAVALENARLFASVRQTLDEVTELKNLMEDVFASIASGVITSDTRDCVALVNQAAASILGVPRQELLNAPLDEVLGALSPTIREKLAQVKENDERFIGLELEPTLPERGVVNLSLNLAPLKTADRATRGVTVVVDDLTEKRRLEAQRRLFERMVSPAVIDQLDPDSLRLGGRRAAITTLFADIRGFTSFSESTDPETLVGVLNQYLAAAAEAILKEEGTVDKYSGDAVMAWFNAPIPQQDHTLRAARSALAIRDSIDALHRSLPPTFHLGFGIGIHFGEALLGLIGSQRRLDYTAIGDSVNTAKRLQEKAHPGQILMTRETAERVRGEVVCRQVPPIRAEGKERLIDVVELVSLKP